MIAALDLPHRVLRERLRDGAIAWITVNPIEYHGPHLPLHTDRWQAEGLVRDLHTALGEAGEPLVCSDLEMGVEPAPGPGSRAVSYAIVAAEVRRAAFDLADLGARRIGLVTFHGAPLHNLALHDAVVALRARGVAAVAPFQAVLRLLLDTPEDGLVDDAIAMLAPPDRARVFASLPTDFHAGYFETSLMLHWAAHTVDPSYTALPPCPPVTPDRRLSLLASAARRLRRESTAAELAFASVGLGWQRLAPHPGYSGLPSLASPHAGAAFAKVVLGKALPVTRAGLAGRPLDDRPPLAWVGPLTAWGRVAP